MVDRKYTEALPGPFPDFSGGAWGRGYVLASSTGHSQILSRSRGEKSGEGLVLCPDPTFSRGKGSGDH